jgi:oligopeptide transport system ATP-binding protein
MSELLAVQNLETRFHTREGTVHAVNGISFQLKEGQVLGIVGESGCGKSVAMLSLLGLISSPPGEIVGGQALYIGRDLLHMSNDEIRRIRGSQISMIFQDPMTSLNPVLPIGQQVEEPINVHTNLDKKERINRVVELLQLVGLPDARNHLNDYPHQFSGGMRQRVMIGMALACNPQILIADEPTTALDVTIQAQIIELVKRFRDEFSSAIIWITHDLGVIAGLAHRVAVMYAGFIIEEAAVRNLFENPRHPYTIGLLGSQPRLDAIGYRRLVSIDGTPPVLLKKPLSCPFLPRCNWSVKRCHFENPPLELVSRDHRVACWVDTGTRSERK